MYYIDTYNLLPSPRLSSRKTCNKPCNNIQKMYEIISARGGTELDISDKYVGGTYVTNMARGPKYRGYDTGCIYIPILLILYYTI